MENNFYKLTYLNSNNLGDQIQTIATEQFFDSAGGVDRDALAEYDGEKINLLMQGWFGYSNKIKSMFPPSNKINPIFVGFHIQDNAQNRNFYSTDTAIKYYKKHEPIGCRDVSTRDFLSNHGVDAYFSRCLSTTLPDRTTTPSSEKIFIVDCHSDMFIPSAILKKAEKLTHTTSSKYTRLEQEEKAKLLLKRYREEATLVITSRLHCASPCIAMGIPVIYIENTGDARLTAISDLIDIKHINKWFVILNKKIFGVKILSIFWPIQYIYAYFFKRKVDWNPSKLDIESTKNKIVENVVNAINKKGN